MKPMVGVRCAFVTDGKDQAGIDTAQQGTHDLLLADLGTSRRGRVRWGHYSAKDGAGILRRLESDFGQPTDPAMMLALDTYPGGLLVVAMCDYEATA